MEGKYMSGKKHGKNRKWVEKGTLAVLIVFAAGVAALVFFMVRSLAPGKEKEPGATKAPEAAATTEPPANEEDLTRYTCKISDKKDDGEGSEFCMEFNEKLFTYRELINTGDTSSEIDRGTFQKEKDGIRMEGRRGNKNFLLYEQDYLVSQNALFEENVPKQETFQKTFTHVVDGESRIVIEFKKNGTFSQKVTRYSAGLDGKDTSESEKGTYRHKGRFIERTGEDGLKLMPYFIYKDKLCTSYYKKIKK